ncbi:hypothetical protein [Bacteroides sp. 14(A)]|uniref:hypothetical protein n=1 Tax=Bacteroides sp. 14(A) TaxID=1163670 RepID=UPI0004785A4C|nr:hypothetical protein [Bacteroides sp. 14(A)]
MTLCVSWIRKVNETEELIFATDSCLSGGERWHSGVKLFELPRRDCLICFAGETTRTYPLILNLISSIKFDEHLSNTHTDIVEVLDYLTNLFTELCNSIMDYGTQDFQDVLGEFEFLFGGWSWKQGSFKVWKLKYAFDTNAFIHNAVDENEMFYEFIGDEIDKAEELLEEEIKNNGKVLSRHFDMEPFKVLLKMIRNTEYNYIDGAIQIAKIHPPGTTEFFGVYWPSIGGKKTFLGKDVTFDNNPAVKFIDPDTACIIGEELPETLSAIEESVYGINTDFIKKCYPGGKLRGRLSKWEIHLVRSIFNDIAYAQFLENEKDDNTIEP